MLHSLPIIYFHGMPGSPRELDLFLPRIATDQIYAPDRNRRSHGVATNYLDALATTIRTRHPAGQVRFIAFSLGVLPALQVAKRLGSRVACIDLVSPAAPWQAGKFPGTAGATVFTLAERAPWLFSRLVGLQALAAHYACDMLYSSLFASARGADRELAQRHDFRAKMIKVLADCLVNDATGYQTEIFEYVLPRIDLLPHIEQPVTLWHGDADNWTPVEMTTALHAALPNVTDVRRFPGLSHYSTLAVALGERLS